MFWRRKQQNNVIKVLEELIMVRRRLIELLNRKNTLLQRVLDSYTAGEWEGMREDWDKSYGYQKTSFLYYQLEKNEKALLIDEFNWRNDEAGELYDAKLIKVNADIMMEYHHDSEFFSQDLVIRVRRGYYLVAQVWKDKNKELNVIAYMVCWLPGSGLEVIRDKKEIKKRSL
jgi:hypothetical protein